MENDIMSDQTPEILGGNIAGEPAEPSMEDILASIRRIIADDEVVGDTPSDTLTNENVDMSMLAAVPEETLDQNNVLVEPDTPIDSDVLLLDDILDLSEDDFDTEDLEIPTVSFHEDDLQDDILIDIDNAVEAEASLDDAASALQINSENTNFTDDIDIKLDDKVDVAFLIEDNLDDDTDIMGIVEAGIADIEERQSITTPNASASLNLMSVETPAVVTGADDVMALSMDAPDDDVIDLVGNLLGDTDADSGLTAAESVFDIEDSPAPQAAMTESDITESISGDEDMDLVKSLMADLTDNSFIDDDMLPAQSEESAVRFDINDEVEAEGPSEEVEADLVDHILDMAIEDEIALNDDLAAEPDNSASLNTLETEEAGAPSEEEVLSIEDILGDASLEDSSSEPEEEPEIDPIDATVNSLLMIAASADMDAETPLESSFDDPEAGEPMTLDENIVEGAENGDEIETEDVDMALTPETSDEDSDLAAFLDSDLSGETDEPSSGAENDDVLAALMSAPETSLDDAIFDTPEIDSVDDGFEDILPDEEMSTPQTGSTESNAIQTDFDASVDDLIISPKNTEQETTEMPKLVAKDGIIDDITEAATVEAFASLNQVVDEKTEYEQSGPRIGDLVQEALQPMLKEWLDENLKGIVERAVTKEVKRISSGK